MNNVLRKTAFVIVLGPFVLFAIIGGAIIAPFMMASLNWILGGRGGFKAYYREVRREISSMMIEDVKRAWAGIDSKDGR